MGEILLIAADWQLRALVRAQLLEEGFDVRALPSLEIALTHLLRSGGQPQLTIMDTQGLQAEARQLSDLWRMTGHAPLILCGGALSGEALVQEGLVPAGVLLRPFRVGELVAQVRKVLACPEGDATVS